MKFCDGSKDPYIILSPSKHSSFEEAAAKIILGVGCGYGRLPIGQDCFEVVNIEKRYFGDVYLAKLA